MNKRSMAIGLMSAAAVAALTAGCSGGSSGAGGQSSAPNSSSSAPSSSSSAPSSSSSSASPAQGSINDELKANPIKFALNKATLDAKSETTLKTIATSLNKEKDAKIKITGYVVPHSVSAAQEKTLSTSRAEAVATALEKDGIDKSRITTQGGGAGQGGASASIELQG